MRESHLVTAQDIMNRIIAARSGEIVPDAGKHILIACMPKSASSYLTGVIGHLPEMKEVFLTYGHHRREQELCPFQCAIFHHLHYVSQAHVRYSEPTQEILTRFSIFPVVVTRNIYDCVVSLRDHLAHESLDIPQAYVPRHFRSLTVPEQHDFVVDLIVPWYANFLASWAEYDGPCVRLTYERLFQDFPAAVATILNATGFACSGEDIALAISAVDPKDRRFNVGQIGRGVQQLTDRQIEKIRQQFSVYRNVCGIDDVLNGTPMVPALSE